jgi:hypothetical protein
MGKAWAASVCAFIEAFFSCEGKCDGLLLRVLFCCLVSVGSTTALW